jgi:triosephosphate isomerase
VSSLLNDSRVLFGSQNVADRQAGAYTGEVSAQMLKEFGCTLAIVGHSERRALYGESNELVAERFRQAVGEGLVPVLCVGETLDQRQQDKTFDIIDAQLNAVLDTSGTEALDGVIVAYEPVWAIGTGMTATDEQAQEVHQYIRNRVADRNQTIAQELRIVYGGSVKPDNAARLFSMPDIDGGLIGGASLEADSFLSICCSV